ncbi:hypothetical protein [Afipia broomeae]|uniref:Glycosyltransferase RgtA/B/C/D-like domain-containing protein n=2 Tax=Pseudomonadota TaxID=1224 RepID=K8PDK6_9BRAD|nr:hypothetical protein [Afipia broomeae]EKS39646.1 hypothetical protein HMPREF9695_01607 [Afipia broomeae ATCC 49717]
MTASPDSQTSASPSPNDPRSDALARLTPFGWNGGLAFILALLAASFFLAGYFVIYWRNADMDFMIVYNALVMNDGKPQAFFDHPSYFTILSVKWWFQVMHSLGLLDAWKLSSIPSALNVPAFDAAMTQAVRAGRIVAWLTATIFVIGFAALARCIFRDWRIALLATFAFAFSGGIAVHMRILRSELIAACLFTLALMLLIAVSRRAGNWRPLALAGAAALCVLGMENKVQIILLIAALPVIMLPFGSADSASAPFWRGSSAWLAVLLSAIAAGVMLALAWPLIAAGLEPESIDIAQLHALIAGRFGIYQIALLGWIGVGMIAFAALWRVSAAETLASVFAVTAGASLGLLALYLEYDPQNAVAVINPIEKMLVFADAPATSATEGGKIWAAVALLFDGVKSVLQRYTFVLFTSPRPTVFLTWLVFPGIVYAWLRGERQTAIQAAVLLLSAIGIDALGVRRNLKAEYFILTDPLIIIAGALLLEKLSDLRFSKWAYPIGVALIVAHVAVSQAEPVKHVLKRSGPEYICEWNEYYEPLLPMPWCDKPPKRP